MNAKKESIVLVGAGVVACAACCAAPLTGFFVAVGMGTAVGAAAYGLAGLVLGLLAVAITVGMRRRRRRPCRPSTPTPP